MTFDVAYFFSHVTNTYGVQYLKKKNDILTMKSNNNANFQAKKYSHKAQQRTFTYFISWLEDRSMGTFPF